MGARSWGIAVVVVVVATLTVLAGQQGQAVVGAAVPPPPPPPPETETVSCGDAVSALIPCGAYLMGAVTASPAPSDSCCRGVRALRRMAGTPAARRAVCRCLEQSGPSFGVVPDRARQLPARCHLRLGIPVAADTDCDRIS